MTPRERHEAREAVRVFYTVAQLASRWQCSAKSVRILANARMLESTRPIGRSIRFSAEAVEEWERKRTTKARK